jgi:hypothetical protein
MFMTYSIFYCFFVQEEIEEETYDVEQEEESREAESFQSYIASRQQKLTNMVREQQAAANPPPNT